MGKQQNERTTRGGKKNKRQTKGKKDKWKENIKIKGKQWHIKRKTVEVEETKNKEW